jgi:hypothetical protein
LSRRQRLALGHDRQSLFEMAPGLFDISPSDAGHCQGSGDDHISQFGEEVIAAAADPSFQFRVLGPQPPESPARTAVPTRAPSRRTW